MIYLDYAANCPVDKKVLEDFNLNSILYYANPNSTHKLGLEAKEKIDEAVINLEKAMNNLKKVETSTKNDDSSSKKDEESNYSIYKQRQQKTKEYINC